MVGNSGESIGIVYYQHASPGARLAANRPYAPSMSYSIVFTGGPGSNAGTVVDESNQLSGRVENDTGVGALIAQYADAAPPTAGLWDVGDRVIRRTAAVGGPKGWRCTTAGNPGTWTSEGNL